MIAEPPGHIENTTLRDLLEDRLPRDQTDSVESHLSRCTRCRDELEQIAGEKEWWDETVGVLSQSAITAPGMIDTQNVGTTSIAAAEIDRSAGSLASDQRHPLDPSLQWIAPLLNPSAASQLGQIDQYPIEAVIGQGGMGVVLRGTDLELNRPVAIKILAPHLAGVGAARTRFMREAQAAAAIVHPSIVPIYSIATTARLPYIVMPFIAGGNLQQKIDRDGPLELAELLRIGLQIAEGLQAAHRQGVIHRDIKPANILIEEGNGRVVISDFGLARALDDATLTVSGMIAGTPQYMSPEQARGESVDPRSDLFSLGSLLYALAIGRPPFRGESPLAVLRKISDTKPRPIVEINEQMPAWLDRLISQLMTVEKSQRIGSAGQAVALLSEAVAYARSPANCPLPKGLADRRISPLRRLFVAAAVPLALVGGYLVAESQANRRSATPPTPTPRSTTDSPSPSAAETQRNAAGSIASGSIAAGDTPELGWFDGSLNIDLIEINRQLDSLSALIEPSETISPSPSKTFPPREATPVEDLQ